MVLRGRTSSPVTTFGRHFTDLHVLWTWHPNRYRPRELLSITSPLPFLLSSLLPCFSYRCHWEFTLPPLRGAVLNPIGAGDTVAGVLLTALVQGWHPSLAFRVALASGSASCMTYLGAQFDVGDVATLATGIVVSVLALL